MLDMLTDEIEQLRGIQEARLNEAQSLLLSDGSPNPDLFEERPCPVCEATRGFSEVFRNEAGSLFVECECGMVFMNPVQIRAQLEGEWVRSEDDPKWAAWEEEALTLKPAKVPVRSERYDLLLKHTNGGRLLDLGCGFGSLTDELKFFFDEVEGLEIDRSRARIATSAYGFPVHTDFIEDCHFDVGFDAAISYNSIEHVFSPRTMVRGLHRNMKPGAILYIECPNVKSASIRILKGKHHLLYSPQHINMFDAHSLSRLLTDAGYEVLEWRTRKLDLWSNDLLVYMFAHNEFCHRINHPLWENSLYVWCCCVGDVAMNRLFHWAKRRMRGVGSYIQIVAERKPDIG